ncbi:pyridoxamine 5'-phosphate oxidase family protein [Lentzea tibetensis]|uniref:pyridoxamine 5'-phosphate oxidase family protein n=1 Tax=Lentzea tibetensis TaxID=2591470 RepID=UPI001647F0E8|nr:pyridoxamine 5'-phosphate oxidase family protein [Lentzea tibetensis]
MDPVAATPRLYGAAAPPGRLLPWEWARTRLVEARTYWIASVSPSGRPHTRPVWGAWTTLGLWFSTGSSARRNLLVNPLISVHLEDGDEVVVVEGTARSSAPGPCLQAYNAKYSWSFRAAGDGVQDDDGTTGAAFLVVPDVVFGWESGMGAPTKWHPSPPGTRPEVDW